MEIENLQIQLDKLGTCMVLKAGTVFTLLMVGKNLHAHMVKVLDLVSRATENHYPKVETVWNDETKILIVLKP